VQRPERRSRLEATSAGRPRGVIPRVMSRGEDSASVHVLRVGWTGTDEERHETQVNDSGHGVFSAGFGGVSRGLAACATPPLIWIKPCHRFADPTLRRLSRKYTGCAARPRLLSFHAALASRYPRVH
jgi:hypothetical protein